MTQSTHPEQRQVTVSLPHSFLPDLERLSREAFGEPIADLAFNRAALLIGACVGSAGQNVDSVNMNGSPIVTAAEDSREAVMGVAGRFAKLCEDADVLTLELLGRQTIRGAIRGQQPSVVETFVFTREV